MKNKYLIGIDVGTSGTKCVLFDTSGNALFSCTEEYPMYQPNNGWAEQNPEDWWVAAQKALRQVVGAAKDGEIAGIGLSGQMHSLVLLDNENKVIRPAILWCDQRTSAECGDIESIIGHDRLIEITANPALPGFTASKIMWVKKNEPENFKKISHILLAKDYIRLKLTGEYATEVSDASGMQLLDVKNRCWSEEVCEKLGVKSEWLAKVYESCEISGRISLEASSLTGLTAGTPVAGGGGDNACAAIGTGVYKDGKAFTTIGTSGVVFAHTSKPIIDPDGRIHTFCAAVPGEWHVMGVTQAAGLSLNWFRNNLAKDVSYSEIDKECEKLPIGSEKLIYLPYLMGERTPILDSDARGVFFGLSAMHTKYHIARSVIEGVSYSLNSCLDVLDEVGIKTSDMALCGGGGKSAFWHKMIADVYGKNIKTMLSNEGAALGAAILAGVAAGIYSSVGEGCEMAVKENMTLQYCKESHEEYMKYYRIYKELYSNIKDSFKQLKNI
ncbi:MAG: xylulokinase [Clostridia bacterium]|nr:xylulokinase [Clostridia bacterium]